MRTLFLCLSAVCLSAAVTFGAELKVGTAEVDITPSRPVLLDGWMTTRVSKRIATPVTANILAVEGEMKGKTSSVIIISCDLVSVRRTLVEAMRAAVKKTLPDFDSDNLLFCATHTHTSAVMQDDKYDIPEGVDCMKPSEFVAQTAEKVAPAVAAAWNGRQPAEFSYGLGFAVVAYSRRAVYADGTAVMYGKTDKPEFRGLEGMEDHDVGTMFFWDKNGKLLAMAVNVSCPAQEMERGPAKGMELHADFWHPTREAIKAKYGKDVTVIGMTGAAGEISPHTMYRNAAEERMRKLRDLSRTEEIARRLLRGINESYELAEQDKKSDVPFRHEYAVLDLPDHKLTGAEYEAAKKQAETLKAVAEKNPARTRHYLWARNAVDRYEKQQAGEAKPHPMPIHVIRIGGVAMLTNPFELFTAYGVQMKARCKATQTIVVELTDAALAQGAGYLPTDEAYRHGGYSAIPQSVRVGPEGGQMLVEESLKRANAMFE